VQWKLKVNACCSFGFDVTFIPGFAEFTPLPHTPSPYLFSFCTAQLPSPSTLSLCYVCLSIVPFLLFQGPLLTRTHQPLHPPPLQQRHTTQQHITALHSTKHTSSMAAQPFTHSTAHSTTHPTTLPATQQPPPMYSAHYTQQNAPTSPPSPPDTVLSFSTTHGSHYNQPPIHTINTTSPIHTHIATLPQSLPPTYNPTHTFHPYQHHPPYQPYPYTAGMPTGFDSGTNLSGQGTMPAGAAGPGGAAGMCLFLCLLCVCCV